MNMNMKNEKTMLALIVVAALALVSVAGVAMSDDVDAGVDVSSLTIIDGDLRITSSTSDSYGIYGGSTVTINADANYTGTLCFGTYDKSAKIFTPYVTLTLKDVSNAIITYTADTKGVTIYVNDTTDSDGKVTGVVSGDIKITQGAIVLGETDYFTGKVAGNTATVDVKNVTGFQLTAGTVDVISGTTAQGSMQYYKATTKSWITAPATVDMTGAAQYGTIVLKNEVTFTVAEDAILTSHNGADHYQIDSGQNFCLTVGNAQSDALVDAAIYDSDGKKVARGTFEDGSFSVIEFTLLADMPVNETYNLQIVYSSGTELYAYSGTVSFAITGDGTNYKATASVGNSTIFQKLDHSDLKFDTGSKTVMRYDNSVYRCLAAYDLNGHTVHATGDYWTKEGTVTFDKDVTADHDLLTILQNKVTGAMYVYYGKIAVDTNVTLDKTNNGVAPLTVATGKAAGKIITGSEIAKNPGLNAFFSVVDQKYVFTIESGAKLVVDGKLTADHVSTTSNGTIVNNGTVDVGGHIYYEMDANSVLGETVNAAYYITTSKTTPKTTYTYTTIKNALAESDDITIIGTHALVEDLELVSSLSGSTSTKVSIQGTIDVGKTATSATAGKTVILTQDGSTSVLFNGTGKVDVENGQFRVAKMTADMYQSSVEADVFYVSSEYGIYTDLATALGLATKSGEIVKLRADAVLSSDAALAGDVTLDAAGYRITIGSGYTFTVNGIIKATFLDIRGAYGTGANAKAAGALVLNKYDKDMTLGTIATGVGSTCGGVITFGTAFDVGTDGAVSDGIALGSGTETNPSIVNVNGNVKYGGTVTGSGYATFNVAGTFTFAAEVDVRGLIGTANVTGTLTAKGVTFAVAYMNVTGNGVVASADGGKILVVKEFVSGTPSDDISVDVNKTKADIVLDNKGKAMIYGSYDGKDISVGSYDGKTALYKTVFYVDKNVVYKTQIGYINDDLDLTIPVFASYDFIGWYDAAVNGTKLTAAVIDKNTYVYGYTQVKTTSVTLSMVQNGTYVINGIEYGTSGNVELPFSSSYGIQVIPANGYQLSSDFQILVNGKAIAAGYVPQSGDVISFSGTIDKKVVNEGIDLVTILLVIITMVIVIMAIIIAMKLMRS